MPQSVNDRRSIYEILACVGTGTYSNVYKAIKKTDGKIVAIKVIDVTLLDKSGIDNVLNEVRILSSLSSQYIVEYYEAFIDPSESFFWIVMEYLGGGDLANTIKMSQQDGIRINEAQIWSYMIQILRGVAELHKLKIVHRDIKPANIFLTDDFRQAKIGDLNVSKVLKQDLTKTQIGTPYYLAPEIWNKKAYDFRADIFSLGALLYELAALKHPHEARTSHELHQKLMNDTIVRIPFLYSEELNTIIQKCLVKEQMLRPTAEQLLNSRILKQKMEELCFKNDLGLVDDPCQLADTIAIPKKLSLLNKKLPTRANSKVFLSKGFKEEINLTNELTNDSMKSHKTAKVVVRDIVKRKVEVKAKPEPVIGVRKSSKGHEAIKPIIESKVRNSFNARPSSEEKSVGKPLITDRGSVKLSVEKLKIKTTPDEPTRKSSVVTPISRRPPLPPCVAKPKTPTCAPSYQFKSEKPSESKPLVSDRANPPLKMPKNFNGIFLKKVSVEKAQKADVKRSSNQSMQKIGASPGVHSRHQSPQVTKYADYLKHIVDKELSPKKIERPSASKRHTSANKSCA